MSIELVQLTHKDYDEWVNLINRVFSIRNGYQMDFERDLPKMCQPTDEAMNKHFGIRKDGTLRSVLGVYPLPLKIMDTDLLFSTMGNVATLPEDEGNGYMSRLLPVAMQELERIGADGSRLCGKRERYNRYGFEQAGGLYRFQMDWVKCVETEPVSLTVMGREDEDLLTKTRLIHDANLFHVVRDSHDAFYKTLTAWRNTPYAAINAQGDVIGYISVTPDEKEIGEIRAVSAQWLLAIIQAWTAVHKTTKVVIMPHQVEEVDLLSRYCADVAFISPSHFWIRGWEKTLGALLKLKATYTELPDYEKIVGIEGYGNLLIRCKGQETLVEKTAREAAITLGHNDATRYLLGTVPHGDPVLPLPLTWALQDRV